MLNRSRPIRRALLLALCLPGMMPHADADELTLPEIIRQVLAQTPQLAIHRLDTAISASEIQRVEGLLDPVVTAKVGVIDDQTPVTSSFQPSRTQTAQATGSLSQPLANGDTVTGSITYNRNRTSFSSPFAAQLATVNPAYRSQLDLSYRHALLRGAGRPDYRDALAAAHSDADAVALQRQTIARTLALQAVNAYYLLVNDAVQVRLARQAVERASRLVEYQRFRERFGLIERSDRIQTEALLAARRQELAQAEAQRAADTTAVNRLMLRAPDTEIAITDDGTPPEQAPADYAALIDSARRHRPEFAILEAQLKATQARLAQAKDGEQSQLDLVAQLGTRALDGSAGNAAARTLSTSHPYAALSLEYSDTIGDNAARAAIRKAELSRERIVEQQKQQRESVQDDIAGAWTTLRSGIPAYRQARAHVDAERRKLAAELTRYREGRSDTATVIQFETDLSNAEQQAEAQGINLMLAEKQLAWAQGTLLSELGIHLEQETSRP